MTFKEIQELIKLVSKAELAEFKMKDGDFELAIRTKFFNKSESQKQVVTTAQPLVSLPPVQPAYTPPPAQAPASPKSEAGGGSSNQSAKGEGDKSSESHYVPVRSPMVGTFYRSSSPDKPPYVKVGDTIEVGSVVCVVEAMKLFNEIESETSGKIVKVLVEDAQPVEYDQVLFLVDPKG